MAAVACVAVGAGAALPATGAADQTVVSATIFPGTAGTASTQPVLLSTLASPSCVTYTGPSWTFPDGQGPLTTGTVWSLGEVISCGLGTTEANVTAVKVLNGDTNGYESTLTPADVFNPDTYPSGALPLISVDGTPTSGGAVTYTRPPAGSSDEAQSDQFTEDGTTPVSIDVYENQLPLNITPAAVYGTSTASSQEVTLAATVAGADGAAIDPSQLTWSWTFAGAPVGSAATPVVNVGAGSSELATVIVSDQATGTGGTATFPVTYDPHPGPPADTKNPGAGNHKKGHPTGTTKLKHARGLDHAGTNKGAGTTRSQRHSTSTSTSTSQSSTATTPVTSTTSTPATPTPPAPPPTIQTTTITTPTPTTSPGLTVDTSPTKSPTKSPQHKPTHTAKRRSATRPGAAKRLVTGRLVADVQALPAGESPLVHPSAAQAAAPSLVHAAANSLSAPTWAYASLAVLALLGAGALYERRGRRGRTLHR